MKTRLAAHLSLMLVCMVYAPSSVLGAGHGEGHCDSCSRCVTQQCVDSYQYDRDISDRTVCHSVDCLVCKELDTTVTRPYYKVVSKKIKLPGDGCSHKLVCDNESRPSYEIKAKCVRYYSYCAVDVVRIKKHCCRDCCGHLVCWEYHVPTVEMVPVDRIGKRREVHKSVVSMELCRLEHIQVADSTPCKLRLKTTEVTTHIPKTCCEVHQHQSAVNVKHHVIKATPTKNVIEVLRCCPTGS